MASDGWTLKSIDELKAQTNGAIAIGPFGSRMKSDCYVPSGVPVIRGNNISDTRVFVGEMVHITPELANQLGNAIVHADDLVFPHRGAIGQVGIVPRNSTERYALSSSLMKLTCDRRQVEPLFLFYFFRSSEGQHELLKNASTVGTPGIGQPLSSLRSIKVPLPPLPEQKAIAHILGTLDDKIELNRRMNATLEAMARALFQSWFVDFDPVRRNKDEGGGRRDEGVANSSLIPHPSSFDFLFPAHFQDSPLGPIPQGWKVGIIQDCCAQIQNGGTPRRDEPRYWEGGTIPWLASGEVRQSIITATDSFITDAGLAESSAKWVPAYSTVIALYGATAGQVSFVSLPLTTNQAVCSLIPKKGFAFFNYLTMRGATTELENKAVGSAQQNISKGIVEETQVVLPPTSLIEQFAVLVGPLFERWIANLHQSRTIATLRDTLLPKLLSGELSVAELRATMPPASPGTGV